MLGEEGARYAVTDLEARDAGSDSDDFTGAIRECHLTVWAGRLAGSAEVTWIMSVQGSRSDSDLDLSVSGLRRRQLDQREPAALPSRAGPVLPLSRCLLGSCRTGEPKCGDKGDG